MSRCRDQEAGAELAHALGISCEDFTSGAADILLRHLALHAQAARIEGARAMQEPAAKVCAIKIAIEQERGECGISDWIDAWDMASDAITSLDPHTITGEAG